MILLTHSTKKSLFLLIPFLLLCLMPDTFAELTLIEQIQQNTQSIVTVQSQKIPARSSLQGNNIQVLEQSGAGIILDQNGYLVTNTHIILNADHIFVTLHNGARLTATIAAIAPQSDFTILKINVPMPLRPMPWSDSAQISLNDEIISVGNSAIWKQTICAGRITGLADNLTTGQIGLIEMDLDLDRGDSGGPILDRHGKFLGIIIAKNTRTRRSSYALPAWEIRAFYQKYLNESLTQHAP